ncbi:MAG: hypothetical protein ACYCUZ_05395 [Cuniculiplasma sp.]|jgi:Holliday junction resolvase
MNEVKSVTSLTKIKKVNIGNNRKNGKRYEGELIKVLKKNGLSARLGRSNEEGDVILPDFGIIIEAKSTSLKDRYRISKSPDQYFRLLKLSQEVWFAIRYKGNGLEGWRFHRIPETISALKKNEGYTLREFVFIIGLKNGSETTQKEKDDEIPELDETSHSIPLELSNRRVAG